jgi:hypothetical protein
MHIDKRAKRLLADPVSEGPDDELLKTQEVANWIETSDQFLDIARCRGTGPAFVRIGPNLIRYRRGDVRDWLNKRSHMRTSEYGSSNNDTRKSKRKSKRKSVRPAKQRRSDKSGAHA